MPQEAMDILLSKGNLTPDQIAYLEKYPVSVVETSPVEQTALETTPAPAEQAATEEYTVKGKTPFGELITWALPQEVIEQLIGAPMPDAAMALKDYASANALNFETLKPALQAEVDKVRP